MTTNVNVLTWNDDRRRMSSYIVFGLAFAIALGALATYLAASAPAWLYWALVALLALLLVFMAVLLFVPARGASAAAEAVPMATSGEASPEVASAPVAYEPRVLTLRCGDCGTIFDVTDTGERPLYHTCPGCGAEGALRDEPVAQRGADAFANASSAVMAGPEAAPEPASEAYAAPPAPEPEMAPAPYVAPTPAAPAMKKIKLRCGGCKEVFTIEDTGERPLQRACPHCGRMGRIN